MTEIPVYSRPVAHDPSSRNTHVPETHVSARSEHFQHDINVMSSRHSRVDNNEKIIPGWGETRIGFISVARIRPILIRVFERKVQRQILGARKEISAKHWSSAIEERTERCVAISGYSSNDEECGGREST